MDDLMVICHIHTRCNFFLLFFFSFMAYGFWGLRSGKITARGLVYLYSFFSSFGCNLGKMNYCVLAGAIKTVGKTVFLKLSFPVHHPFELDDMLERWKLLNFIQIKCICGACMCCAVFGGGKTTFVLWFYYNVHQVVSNIIFKFYV